ncbi:MAG: ABC transporter permease [Acidobacteriota bacterium]
MLRTLLSEIPRRLIRSVARPLRREPLATFLVIAVLAIGLGMALAVFAVAEDVLLRDLPARDADRLVKIAAKRLDSGGLFTARSHQAHRWRQAPSLQSLAMFRRGTVHLRRGDRTERLGFAAIGPEYFETLGVAPIVGRAFDHSTKGPAALISHALWQSHFGGELNPGGAGTSGRGVIGKTLELDGTPHVVLGVMPPSQEHAALGWLDVWTRLEIDDDAAGLHRDWGYSVVARLRDGADVESASRELEAISARLAGEAPEAYGGWGAETRDVRGFMAESLEKPLAAVQAAALLVLLIAALTAGHLLFAITSARRQELALRRALGAGGGRLARQLFAEIGALVLVASALGGLTATAAGRLIVTRLPADLLQLESFSVGPRAAALATGAAAGVLGLCFVVAAVALSRAGIHHAARRAGQGGHRLRTALIVAETALSTVAIAGTLFLLFSLRQVEAVPPGFDADGLITLRLEMGAAGHPDKETRRAALEGLQSDLEALPGVESAALAGFSLPLTGGASVFQVWVEGHPRAPQPDQIVNAQVVSSGFFDTLGSGASRAVTSTSAKPGTPNAPWSSTGLSPSATSRRTRPSAAGSNSATGSAARLSVRSRTCAS